MIEETGDRGGTHEKGRVLEVVPFRATGGTTQATVATLELGEGPGVIEDRLKEKIAK
jgi:hypothetical protein